MPERGGEVLSRPKQRNFRRISPLSLFRAAPLLFAQRAIPFLRVSLEKQVLAWLERVDDPYRRWQRDFEPRRARPPGAGRRSSAARRTWPRPGWLPPRAACWDLPG